MNSYEEERHEFRPRPKHLALFVFGMASVLLADAIQSLVTWAIQTTLAWNSGWDVVWIIDIPVLTDPSSVFYVSPPLESPWTFAGEIVAISFLVLGAALVYLWPTESSLASRLYIHISAVVFVLEGAIGIPLERTELFQSEVEMSRVSAIVLALLGFVVLLAIQRSLLVVLQQFWDLYTATERLGLFATLQLPGLLLLASFFWFNGFTAGSIATAVAAVPLVYATGRYVPRTIYERVTTHSLARANVVIMILAAACVAGSIWTFGFELIERERRAFTWSPQRGPALQTHAEILRQQLREPETLDGEPVNEKPVIRWSNP